MFCSEAGALKNQRCDHGLPSWCGGLFRGNGGQSLDQIRFVVPVNESGKLGRVGEASGIVFGDVGANGSGSNGSGGVSRCAGGRGQVFATGCGIDEHAEISRAVASNAVGIGQIIRFDIVQSPLRLCQLRAHWPTAAGS